MSKIGDKDYKERLAAYEPNALIHEYGIPGALAVMYQSKVPRCETCKWFRRIGIMCDHRHGWVNETSGDFGCIHWEAKP